MTQTTDDQIVTVAKKPTCWVELNLWRVGDDGRTGSAFKQSNELGRPDRIFSSSDPMWAELEKSKSLDFVSICVGTFSRVGPDILPATLKMTHHLRVPWRDGLEKMRFFEAHGRLYDTPESDAIRDHDKAREQGQTEVANAVRDGLSQLVASMAAGVKK